MSYFPVLMVPLCRGGPTSNHLPSTKVKLLHSYTHCCTLITTDVSLMLHSFIQGYFEPYRYAPLLDQIDYAEFEFEVIFDIQPLSKVHRVDFSTILNSTLKLRSIHIRGCTVRAVVGSGGYTIIIS